jgi:hypothetical protein
VGRQERNAYLSEAAAAMLSRHPAFHGIPDTRGQLPKVNVAQRYSAKSPQRTLVVSGRVQSNIKPVYAIVADESEANPGEYWTKHYVGEVSANGNYQVTINELAPKNGTLKTWFVFENGATTGNGRKRGKAGAVSKNYRFVRTGWQFQ